VSLFLARSYGRAIVVGIILTPSALPPDVVLSGEWADDGLRTDRGRHSTGKTVGPTWPFQGL